MKTLNKRDAKLKDFTVCANCALGEVEDEQHFLIKCPAYSDLRNKLFASISTGNPLFTNYSDGNKFLWLMWNEDLHDLKITADFVYQAMRRRSK